MSYNYNVLRLVNKEVIDKQGKLYSNIISFFKFHINLDI